MSSPKQYTYPSYAASRNIVEIPVESLHEIFRYDPETGLFHWKARGRGTIACEKMSAEAWNRRWAGKQAFTRDNGNGYLVCSVNRKNYAAHRVAFAMHYGKWPEGHIDHINHDKKDNRIQNLRDVPAAENHRNTSGNSRNTSGVTGVRQERGKWVARIRGDGRHLYLGIFDDFDAACAARRDAEARFGYHPNHGKKSA